MLLIRNILQRRVVIVKPEIAHLQPTRPENESGGVKLRLD